MLYVCILDVCIFICLFFMSVCLYVHMFVCLYCFYVCRIATSKISPRITIFYGINIQYYVQKSLIFLLFYELNIILYKLDFFLSMWPSKLCGNVFIIDACEFNVTFCM